MEEDRDRNAWTPTGDRRAEDYEERFERLAARGVDVHGEASLVASLRPRSVLDAGCGTGRVAIELARRGFDVVGVDLDPAMLAIAREKAPGLTWIEGDIADVEVGRTFDAVVMAGNVMVFVATGTEGAVLANLGRHLRESGLLVSGFSLTRDGLGLDGYDSLATAAGLELTERWATWDRRPFLAGGDYAVSVHRRAAG